MAGRGRSGGSKRKRVQTPPSAAVEVAESPAAAGHLSPATGLDDLVLKYHAMAEEFNSQGAMELAVPFYRQAIALLMTEREQLRRQAGDATGFHDEPAGDRQMSAVSAAVHGVLEAAATAGLPVVELERQLSAIEDSLSVHNLVEAGAALEDLEHRWGHPHVGLSALAARLALLGGDLAEAHAHYERALALDSRDERLRINAGAARLAMDDPAGAAELLRPLAAEADRLSDPDQLRALWKNLARVEYELGQAAEAVHALLRLLELAPEAFDLEPWLEACRGWIAANDAAVALQLLEALRPHVDASPSLLSLMAEALEALGRYRDAALVYRQLLRPSLQ